MISLSADLYLQHRYYELTWEKYKMLTLLLQSKVALLRGFAFACLSKVRKMD